MALAICLIIALLIVVLAALWRLKPTKLKITLKLWKLVHLELESESAATSASALRR